MPIRYEIDTVRALVRGDVDGVVRDEDLHRHRMNLHVDPGLPFVLRLPAGERSRVTADGVRAMASISPKFEVTKRMAFVVVDEVGFGLGRMYEQLSLGRPREVRIFRRIDEAEAWLGLEARAAGGA